MNSSVPFLPHYKMLILLFSTDLMQRFHARSEERKKVKFKHDKDFYLVNIVRHNF